MIEVCRHRRVWLAAILLVSLGLNVWGIDFGLAESGPAWHPDQVVVRAIGMARDFTLKPPTFLYGSLHFYQALAVMLPAYLVSEVVGASDTAQRYAVWLAARGLSAVLGTACVALTFIVSHRLFGTVAAIVAAASLALTMGLVSIAHFASVDVPMLFWMLASFLMASRILTSGERYAYVLAGVFAGLAAGTKYIGGAVIVSLVAAYALTYARRDHLGLAYGVLASAVAFVAVNPALLFASCEFFEGFIKDNAFNTSLDAGKVSAPVLLASALYEALGAGLLALVCLALAYAGFLLLRRRATREILLLAALLVPFALAVGNVHYASSRHVLPLIPPLLILAGKMIADLLGTRPAWLRGGALVVAVLALAWSAVYTVGADLAFVHDPRKPAGAWIRQHVPPGSTIEMSAYGPNVSRERFEIVRRPVVRDLGNTLQAMTQGPIYELLYPLFVTYRGFAESVGLCPYRRPHYEGWYERTATDAQTVADGFHLGVAGLHARRPDYLVVSEQYYKRWFDSPETPEGEMFAALFAGRTQYEKVAEFEYHPWLDPEVEFINRKITIFAPRGDAAAAK